MRGNAHQVSCKIWTDEERKAKPEGWKHRLMKIGWKEEKQCQAKVLYSGFHQYADKWLERRMKG